MILVDTNIIIDFWKNPDQEKKDVFSNNEIAICHVVKAELIHGAKSPKEKRKIGEALNELTMLTIDEDTWEAVCDYLYKLKKKGLTVPFQDVLIAAAAVQYDCLLWTNDKHFSNISKIIKKLELFTF